MFWSIVWCLGMWQIFLWLYRTGYYAFHLFYGAKVTTERYGKNSWAVVTGATDGIGKGFAIELAKRGFNIVLISRTMSKLEQVAKEIQEIKGPDGKNCLTRVIANDFVKSFDHKAMQTMYDEHLKDLDISILCNNVGAAKLGEFSTMPVEEIQQMMTCNMYPVATLTKAVIQSFRKRYDADKSKKIRSAIINTAAMMSVGAPPIGQVYAATKVYNDFLSEGLAYELSGMNVDVTALRPAGVTTNMMKESNAGSIMPEELAVSVFDKVTQTLQRGHPKHEIPGLIFDNIKDIWPAFGEFIMAKLCVYAKKSGHA